MVDNTPLSTGGYPMRILAMDQRDLSLNLYNATTFRALGASGYYIASWYNNRLYNAHISPDVLVTVNSTQYKAGDLFDIRFLYLCGKALPKLCGAGDLRWERWGYPWGYRNAIPLGLHGGPAVLHVL